jgi:tetratricopeptide (TPR) repeat protein
MRCLLLSVSLLLSTVALAGDPSSPAAYLAILMDSKLHYNMVAKASKTPVQVQTCPRRDETMRVVVDGAKKSLMLWSLKPEVPKLLAEGEALFQAEDYAGAAARYLAAIELDPEAAPAYLFYGDALLMGAKQPAEALAQYQKAVALDPTLPSAHFFSSTAYGLLGRKADAREEIVRALTYYPNYEAVWKVATQDPEAWEIKPVTRHRFEPPAGYLGVAGKDGIDIFAGKNNEWLGYALCKAVWANEPQFQSRRSHTGWSVEEEHACVVNQIAGAYNATETALQKKKKPHSEKDVVAALPPLEAHIWQAAQAGLLDGYILFEIIGTHCPLALSGMSDGARDQVDAYIRKYVIVLAN